jgi:hypothetical protein
MKIGSSIVWTLGLALTSAAFATDRWEAGSFCNDGSAAATCNEVAHGSVQIGHDLQGLADQDWVTTQVQARHSYEARVRSGTMRWDGPSCTLGCAKLDRVDAAGTILTPGAYEGPGVGNGDNFGASLVVRWVAPAAGKEYVRAIGYPGTPLTAADQYDLEFLDTTYFAPRFNNSATQVTVLIVQNTRNTAVTGSIYFYSPAGTLLDTETLTLAPAGVQVLATAGIPALQGQAGSIAIAHLGGYGALTGKAVALEAATGFTFDTALTPLPR